MTNKLPAPQLKLSLQFAVAPAEALQLRHILPRHKIICWLKKALRYGGAKQAEFAVRIVDSQEGLYLNNTFRHKNYATNVLTFNYAVDPVYADIILCAAVVAKEAHEQHKDLQQHYAHLLIHGALHAQGYDHEIPAEALEMEELERQAMQDLGFANPYRIQP